MALHAELNLSLLLVGLRTSVSHASACSRLYLFPVPMFVYGCIPGRPVQLRRFSSTQSRSCGGCLVAWIALCVRLRCTQGPVPAAHAADSAPAAALASHCCQRGTPWRCQLVVQCSSLNKHVPSVGTQCSMCLGPAAPWLLWDVSHGGCVEQPQSELLGVCARCAHSL